RRRRRRDRGRGHRSPMSGPHGEEPRVVIRDKRRIDPTSGAVRAPAGEQPAGAPPGASGGEQMSEQQMQAPAQAAAGDGGDVARQLAERTEDLQRVTAEYAN